VFKPRVLVILGMVGAGIVGAALRGAVKPTVSVAAAPALAAVPAVAPAMPALPIPPELNPAALTYKTADQIPWKEAPNGGSATFTAYGDPSKTGLYVQFIKWHPHGGSRPHSHPNDRIIYVISGTWYVNTGPTYDPDHMVPMPAGTVVYHYGKGIHYDGAKDGECVLEIVGEGPANTTNAEEKTAMP
jgi:hypothetical protein